MIVERAPAKINLILHVGPVRRDGLHELCSLFASLDLADTLTVEEAPADEVICAGVDGPNLVSNALGEFRTLAQLPPLRIVIEKLIPVAAGMGGGSADAAAALRAANEIAGRPLGADELRRLGARVGADVPSQVEPRHALVTGAGDVVEPLDLPAMDLVVLPDATGLSTADVYREADRIGCTRERLDPDRLRAAAGLPLARLAEAIENDLEAAALALRPEIGVRRDALLEAGALAARVTGSGPTVFGVFADAEAADVAASALRGLRSAVR